MRLSVSGDLRAAGASGGCLCGLVPRSRPGPSDSTNPTTTNCAVPALTRRNNEGSDTLSDNAPGGLVRHQSQLRPLMSQPGAAARRHRQGEGRRQIQGPPDQHRRSADQAAEGHAGARCDRQEARRSTQQCLSGVGGITAGRILWMQCHSRRRRFSEDHTSDTDALHSRHGCATDPAVDWSITTASTSVSPAPAAARLVARHPHHTAAPAAALLVRHHFEPAARPRAVVDAGRHVHVMQQCRVSGDAPSDGSAQRFDASAGASRLRLITRRRAVPRRQRSPGRGLDAFHLVTPI